MIHILRSVKGSLGQDSWYEDNEYAILLDTVMQIEQDHPLIDSHFRLLYFIWRQSNISKKVSKQDVVARWNAEAEYWAVTLATCELMCLRQLIQKLKIGGTEPMKLICDNQDVLHITSNLVFYDGMKHIEIDCHLIRQKIESGCVFTSSVNSKYQLADVLIKPLRGSRVDYICNKLGACNMYYPTWGGLLNMKNSLFSYFLFLVKVI